MLQPAVGWMTDRRSLPYSLPVGMGLTLAKIMPTTKAQYGTRNYPLPPKLFSHNDQQSVWQTFSAEGTTRVTVRFTDAWTDDTGAVSVTDTARVQAMGEVIATTLAA